MKIDIELAYTPVSPKITEADWDVYSLDPRKGPVAEIVAIAPFEEAMKSKVEASGDKKVFTFGDLKVTGSMQTKPSKSWEKVYSSVMHFLSLRADDSRAFDMDGVKPFDGVGYCILASDVLDFIGKQEDKYAGESTFPQLFWPKTKKDEKLPTEILLPGRDFSRITEENARVVLEAKRFCSGLKALVVDAFKDANKAWYEGETKLSLDNLPEIGEDVRRARKIARGKYVVVNLVREEVPQYAEIISTLRTELTDLAGGNPLEGYRTKAQKEGVYVNIKNVSERLALERLAKEGLVTSKGRYEIVP
jgi:hypothetical protein